ERAARGARIVSAGAAAAAAATAAAGAAAAATAAAAGAAAAAAAAAAGAAAAAATTAAGATAATAATAAGAAAATVGGRLLHDAGVGLIRPLLLHGVAADAALLGIADVADLAVGVVVPGEVVLPDVRVRGRL